MDKILKAVETIKKRNYYPDIPVVFSPHQPHLLVNGRKVLLFASNNYLGMMNDQRVIDAAIRCAEKWSIGSGGSRLHTGNLDIHLELERAIADFKNKEAALTFVAGCMVNEGCIPAIVNVLDVSLLKTFYIKKKKTHTVVFSDEYNHASVINGIKLSGAPKEVYKHNNMDDLEKKLKMYSKKTRKLILADGVFSMNGDIVRLPQLKELAKKYNALVYIDDAHATGILGDHGRGTEDYFNMEGEIDFVMGTFTKAFGGVGGYITGDKNLMDYLKITARSYIFTAPIAPPVVGGLIESIKIVKSEPWRRQKLLTNAQYLREGLQSLGLDTMASETQIIPVLIGNEAKAISISKFLLEKDIFVPVIRWPAVQRGTARLRLTVMASHSREQIDHLLDIMKNVREMKI
ncbi:MAG: aminotransferase class I/II-fold pyridoxal phosphate-dependent enzyme [Planctomycetota bacterium]|jgi:8-amino-7-oxononanoate synthase